MAASHESSTAFEAADGSSLPMLAFEPAEGSQPVAGVVMFHGGALRKGSADGLAPHCERLASRGIFAASAGYRLIDQGATSIDDCLADVRRAVEHFAKMAALRGLNSARLASGGSSAGGHLALVAAMTSADGRVPALEPNVAAVVALNPVVDLLAYSPEQLRSLEQDAGIAAGSAIEYSPIELVRPGNPPILIQHGTHDEVAPIEQARRFRDRMVQAGNACTLLEYDRAEHAFHYPGAGGHFDAVVDAIADFLLDRLGTPP